MLKILRVIIQEREHVYVRVHLITHLPFKEAHVTGYQSQLIKIKLVNNHDEVKIYTNIVYSFQQCLY